MFRFDTLDIIYFDTSAIMEPEFEKFMYIFLPPLVLCGIDILIPQASIREIKKATENSEDCEMRNRLDYLMKIIHSRHIKIEDLLINMHTSKVHILEQVLHYKSEGKRILVITQDHTMAKDLKKINSLVCVGGHAVLFGRIKNTQDSVTIKEFD